MNCRICGSELPESAMFCGECGSSVTATGLLRPAARDPRPSDTTVIEPLPEHAITGRVSNVRSVPVPQPVPQAGRERAAAAMNSALAAAQTGDPASFVLTISTGQRVSIDGAGLLGRRPIAQPGETPQQLITVADTGRSVSKTHLEFGIEGGELWICDRYSANGTVLLPIDGRPRICEPGRRYRVGRGSRVELGDQNFIVS